jgi:adenosylcobinamide-GDP ribazoletransferase
VGRFGGTVGRHAVVESIGTHGMENGGSSSSDIAIDEHRHILQASGQNSARHGGDLASAEATQYLEGITKMGLVKGYGAAHRVGLAAQAFAVNSGTRSHPVLGSAAKQAMGNGCGDRGVADPHFSHAQEVAVGGNRLHAIGHGGRAVSLVEGGIGCDVARRNLECQFEHLQTKVEGLADLVDGGATRLEVGHHLGGYSLGIGSNALGYHAMVAGENGDDGALDPRRIVVLPATEPFGDRFKSAECSGRLGQPAVTGPTGFNGLGIGSGKALDQCANVIEWQRGGGICHFRGRLLISPSSSQDSGSTRNMSDDSEPQSEGVRRFRPFAWLLVSLRFLTRLPIPFVRTIDPPPLAEAMGMFPIAGAVIGAISGAVLVGCHLMALPAYFCAAAALGAGALLTGALHEDGLADIADGFGGGKSREHRLEIMRDSRIGAYGTIALCLTLLARAALLVALLRLPPASTVILVASAAAFSRALMVDLMWATRPARRDGLSVLAGRPSRNTTLLALAIGGLGAGVAGGSVLSPAAGVLALVAGGVALAMVRAIAMRKIGGQTGDVVGAGQVLSETAMLAVYAATLSLP